MQKERSEKGVPDRQAEQTLIQKRSKTTTFWRLYQENGCVRQRVGLINVRASTH
jgi:hypothetical protein